MIRHTLPAQAYNKWTEVSLSALRHNLQILRAACARPQVQIMGIVKANAYSHNVSLIAPALFEAGVRHFGVATLGEALYLRELCPRAEMILILGAQTLDQSQELLQLGFDFVLHTPTDLPALAQTARRSGHRGQVHLKVDTGMGRVGMSPAEARQVLDQWLAYPELTLRGICSHLATSDQPESPLVQQQLSAFCELQQFFSSHPLAAQARPLFHLGNSDAVLQHPQTHFDLVRPGIALYGYSSTSAPLQPVLSLKARITQRKHLPAGHALGYGATFITERPSEVGIVGIGYADGVPRLLSNQQDVLIKGQRAPIIGRISMDQLAVDLTDIQGLGDPGAEANPEVVLIGHSHKEQISAQEWADKLNTIPYEILTGLGTRLPRYAV